MSYTIPNGDSLSFRFSGQPAYTPPRGDSLTFSFVPTQSTGGPLALAASAALELVGQANLVSMALKPLRAVGALSVRAIGIMRSLGTLMLKALARISRVFKDGSFRKRLLEAPDADGMFAVIAEEDAKY